ncbi:hypothetical protein HYFRA_00006995 [Hymenoscyphus fraxineus]|uniref:Anaphase-promoting complex subunit 2 n=1 Tax=Hymenoscyphus fraxineus TaxID=746836 RepID=A0A9N9PPC1_9HELO|nr:hypothetical protein HYFRA_00006995 [Hymenoscyphus fraxineus]
MFSQRPDSRFQSRQARVFDSVFGPVDISQPTPVATPANAFATSDQKWGVLPDSEKIALRRSANLFTDHIDPQPSNVRGTTGAAAKDEGESPHARDQVRWDRSWHCVTHALVLAPISYRQVHALQEVLRPTKEMLDASFYEALEDVVDPASRVPYANHTDNIIVWHTHQVRSHFLNQVLPAIVRLVKRRDVAENLITGCIEILQTAHHQYFHGLTLITAEMDKSVPNLSQPSISQFKRDLHAVIGHSAMEPISIVLKTVLEKRVSIILGLPQSNHGEVGIQPEGPASEAARQQILALVGSLKEVGLAGEELQVIFAEIMNRSMTEYISKGFKGRWSHNDSEDLSSTTTGNGKSILPRAAHLSSPSRCTQDLCEWIENRYAKLAVQIINIIDVDTSVTWANKEKYKEMGIGHLAELRISELFDIVVNWPNSNGALDDLRTSITTPQRRLHLTEAFSKTLSEKLLHPGASTLQILRTYIAMIWSFHSLDHSKVLLDRVAYPLQLYLCSREDTVRIIITGMLAATETDSDFGAGPEKLVELAQLLNKEGQPETQANDEELDWDDLEWVPDPVDAGPGYKRSKEADIIGTLIGALGSQDVFIKEFQNIIGEHLLRNDGAFEKEIKVLELLKTRFGEAPLQACEVMLKDIQDSARVNSVIRRAEALDPSPAEIEAARANPQMLDEDVDPEGLLKPSLHAKILSRLFWPQLQDDTYLVPAVIAELQEAYAAGFETLKSSRKLTWLHTLGQAKVELELEDRKIVEEVHTFQATVIHAFGNPAELEPVSRTVEQLVDALEMEEPLVRSALRFWVSKLVLQETAPSTYTVLETLNSSDRALSNALASAPHANHEEVIETANEGVANEKMQMYWQFIQGMLKNSSSQMPLQQIAMMLKMLIADGFPCSNEELQEFLGGKVAEGELELNGGKYRLRK